MTSLILTPENQIQRLNHLFNQVDTLQNLSLQELTIPPHQNAWSVLEVLEHLNIAYSFYEEKIDKALDAALESNREPWVFKARSWPRLVIEGQRPKGTKRPFKIRTLKRFKPLLAKSGLTDGKVALVFERFRTLHGHLGESLLRSRAKVMDSQKITSAIGPIVRFYLPEAFEFLISHAERHMVQIDEILSNNQSMDYL